MEATGIGLRGVAAGARGCLYIPKVSCTSIWSFCVLGYGCEKYYGVIEQKGEQK